MSLSGGGVGLSLKNLQYQRTRSYDQDSDAYDTDNHMIGMVYPSDSEYESAVDSAMNTPKIAHIREQTSIGTKIKRIKAGTSKNARSKKKKVKDNKNAKDWWQWFWSNPIGHFPFLYYFVMVVLSFVFIIYWFMDNDSSFILCGIVGLSMFSYSTYKFKISMALKKQVVHYKELNIKFKKENLKIEAVVNRAIKAHSLLKKTRKRLFRANNRNRRNLKKFERVEQNMKVMGKKANLKLTEVHKHTEEIRSKWRDECLTNEREMLHAVFNRYERKHTNKSNLGMTEDDFKEFQNMLPRRYASRFDRLGTFHRFADGKSMIDIEDFSNTLDVFAEMETDDKDIHLEITPKPSGHNRQSMHGHHVSSFEFHIKRFNDIVIHESDEDTNHSPKKHVQFKPIIDKDQ